ncbi:mannitol dehydrogenase family protein [Phenylobacterium sp. LjRoot219]|uniref:mannitol dehydrogenase family protein n=1 Tax=Phenylobacterium sp. LjRoot219 TaxID=3342283 RepID=UPI003ED039FF
MRLSFQTLDQVPAAVARPAYDLAGLGCGIVHLGLGAFHRAHQAVYSDAAIAAAGGAWGIVGVSMRKPDVAAALSPQDGLYTVEVLDAEPSYRVVGAVRQALTLPLEPDRVLTALAAPATRIVTLTVTEKGYCLDGAGALDLSHPDIVHDLTSPGSPRSAVGVLAAGLARRVAEGAAPLTVISCDNVADNGARLAAAVEAFAARAHPLLAPRLSAAAAFPQTMVDSIVPATDAASRARIERVLGLTDEGSVQREAFGQWVIEDRFAGPRPAWEQVGVELVGDVVPYRRLKLHVLNASHSALAYLGLLRGRTFVRDAIADPELAGFLDGLIAEEVAPALPELAVGDYWSGVRRRFANPAVDHRLDQIAQDGAQKLAQRIFPLMIANQRAGLPVTRMGRVVRAWIDWSATQGPPPRDLDDPTLFPAEIRSNPALRAAILGAAA